MKLACLKSDSLEVAKLSENSMLWSGILVSLTNDAL